MKERGLARKKARSHNQPAKGDVIPGQVQFAWQLCYTFCYTALIGFDRNKPAEIGMKIPDN